MSDESETAAPTSGDSARGWEAAGLRDLLGNRRLITDTAAAPVTFVAVARLADLPVAAGAALAVGVLIVAVRLLRGHRVRYAAGGFAGVAVAAAAALWSGDAHMYFGPAMALNAAYAAVAVASVFLRRPLVAWLGAFALRWPLAWHWHPRVRPAFAEITWAWAVLFTLRAVLRYGLMAQGQLELLAVVHVALGLPALAALTALTAWYVPRRLRRLDAPSFTAFRPAAPKGALA